MQTSSKLHQKRVSDQQGTHLPVYSTEAEDMTSEEIGLALRGEWLLQALQRGSRQGPGCVRGDYTCSPSAVKSSNRRAVPCSSGAVPAGFEPAAGVWWALPAAGAVWGFRQGSQG